MRHCVISKEGTNDMKFGELLIKSRKEIKKDREQIADEIGVPIEEIKNWEVYDNLPRTLSIFQGMVDAYQLDAEELKEVLQDAF